MALKEFRLPDIGEGIAEGEIVSWKVEPGQQVKEEDEFVEVMTDKATVMITVPYDGVVKELRCKEGDIVPVESVIAVFETGAAAGGVDAPKAEKAGAAAPAKAPAKDATKEPAKEAARGAAGSAAKAPAGGSAAASSAASAAASAKPAAAPAKPAAKATAPADGDSDDGADGGSEGDDVIPAVAPARPAAEPASPGKVLAAPATRRRARELGVDLSQIDGTGPSGRVTNEDLAAHTSAAPAAAKAAPAATATPAGRPASTPRAPIAIAKAPAGATEERIPFRGLRRKIAEAMSRSKQTAAHFTYVDDIHVSKLVALRNDAKALYAERGVNITYLPFIMKAVVAAHREFPMMNCSLDEAKQELVVKHYYNFGIATDTEQGLVVPVVKDVDQKSIAQLAHEIQELSQKTRDGKVSVDQLQGGTFTITNAGNIGGLFATPVINFPEVAILGVHAIKKTPIVDDSGQLAVGHVMYLSVSIDHRIVDGATGARWMNVVKSCLEEPTRLLLGQI